MGFKFNCFTPSKTSEDGDTKERRRGSSFAGTDASAGKAGSPEPDTDTSIVEEEPANVAAYVEPPEPEKQSFFSRLTGLDNPLGFNAEQHMTGSDAVVEAEDDDTDYSDGEMGPYLYIEVVKAQGLLIADKGGTSDPFVEVFLDDEPRTVKATKVKEKTLSPVWNQGFAFARPGQGPVWATFKVWDKDFCSKDFLGECSVDVGAVAVGKVKEVVVELCPEYDENGEVKMKDEYVGQLNKTYGKLTLKLSSGTAKACPKLVSKAEKERSASSASMHAAGEVEAEKTQMYLYVRAIKAKNLIPADKNGKSDPYCSFSLNSSSDSRKTPCMKATLNPTWNQMEPFSFPFEADTRTILADILDEDGFGLNMGRDERLGQVIIPVSEELAPGQIVSEWYDVTPGPGMKSVMKKLTTAKHTHRKLQPAEYGEHGLGRIHIVYSMGYLKDPPASKELQPAFRLPVGRLKVEVLELQDLCVEHTVDKLYFKCLWEGRIEQSKEAIRLGRGARSCNVEQAWAFEVTELMSDVTIELWDEERMQTDVCVGKVVMPCKSLWDFAHEKEQRWETWLLIMPGGPRDNITHLRARPPKPKGCLRVAFTFTIFQGMSPLVYLGNKRLDLNVIRGVPPATVEPELGWKGFKAELGRFVDCLISPLTSGLAVVLYLHSWRDPEVNVGLIAMFGLGFKLLIGRFSYVWPLVYGIYVLVQGYVLYRMRQSVPALVFDDEKEAFMREVKAMKECKAAVAEERARVSKKWEERGAELEKSLFARQKTMKKSILRHGHADADVSDEEVDDDHDMVVKKSFVKQAKEKLTLKERLPVLKQWYKIQAKISNMQLKLAAWNQRMERVGNALCWKDEAVSCYAYVAVAVIFVLAAVAWALLLISWQVLVYILPFDLSALLGFVAVALHLAPLHSRSAPKIASFDEVLLGFPLPLTPVTWDSVPILTARYQKQLEDLREGGPANLGLKRGAERKAAKAAKKKLMEEEERKWQMEEGGMKKLFNKRMKDPYHLLRNLYFRCPSNLEHLHRCRCMRHVMAASLGGEWPRPLPMDQTPEAMKGGSSMLCNSNAKSCWDKLDPPYRSNFL